MEETLEKVEKSNEPKDDKAIGILSYLGILWIVAYIMYGNKKTEYNLFHVKEGLAVLIAWIAFMILSFVPVIGFVFDILRIAVWVFSIIGIINAANGNMKPLPLVHDLITKNLLSSFK